jgi:hypothetical protein
MVMESRKSTDLSTAETLSFEPSTEDGETGVEIIDPIERRHYTLQTPTLDTPEPADKHQFRFPVDKAAAIQTDSIALPNVPLVHVRDDSGEELAAIEQFQQEEFPSGTYTIELHTLIKLFLRIESPLTVQADLEHTVFKFGNQTPVTIGARSYHRHPATTITTTREPEDVMNAVSMLGSAMKTTSPERSFPTLRGHPPTIELGDDLSIPDSLTLPETGIEIELPPEYRFIYPAASLSYYLGAPLVPGDEPQLHTHNGFEYSLTQPGTGTAHGFERKVEQTLKQVFLLDCLTRTEGLYQVDLHERRALEDDLNIDFAALYDAPAAERLATYLDIPFSVVEDHIPDWKLTTHVEATPTSVETLPFVVDDLATIRTPNTDDLTPVSPMEASAFDQISPAAESSDARAGSETGFTRGGSTRSAEAQTESVTNAENESATDELYVQPATADSQEQAWIGEGTPIGASKATTEAYHNRLDRTPNSGDIGITVVCNEPEMNNEENLVDEIYGTHEDLPFDVTIHHELTQDELEKLLASETDFLHYIGHIDDTGFECADGQLDATTLNTVNIDAFLLNACHSYEQGMALIEAGAIGGIVTLNELFNHGAIEMGQTLARLLNCGFPLRSAVEISRNESIVGEQYHVIGDGGLAISQTESTIPNLLELERTGNTFQAIFHTYPTAELGLGGTVSPYLSTDDERYLSSGSTRTFEVSQTKLRQFLQIQDIPVRVDEKLRWSTQIDPEEL